jgi:MYXO-CTERM domain-containing protein
MARAASGQVPAPVSYTVAALAAVVLVWRILRRRRT